MAVDCMRSNVADKEAVIALRNSCLHLARVNRYLRRAGRGDNGERVVVKEPNPLQPVDLRVIAGQIEVHLERAATVLEQLDRSRARFKSKSYERLGSYEPTGSGCESCRAHGSNQD